MREMNLKEALSLRVLAMTVAALSTILGAAFFIDGRYAHADSVAQQVEVVRQETRYSADQLRKQTLEDKIFELNLIPVVARTDIQRALLDRYKEQVREVNSRWQTPPPTTLNR